MRGKDCMNLYPAFRKKNVDYRNVVLGDATSGSVHTVGPFDLKLEQFKQ